MTEKKKQDLQQAMSALRDAGYVVKPPAKPKRVKVSRLFIQRLSSGLAEGPCVVTANPEGTEASRVYSLEGYAQMVENGKRRGEQIRKETLAASQIEEGN